MVRAALADARHERTNCLSFGAMRTSIGISEFAGLLTADRAAQRRVAVRSSSENALDHAWRGVAAGSRAHEVFAHDYGTSPMTTGPMTRGTVKWFNPTMGYGFIQPDGGGAVAFVHISAVQQAGHDKLMPGQRVRYDLIAGRNGDAAENLKLVA